jgi:phasin
MSDVSNEASNDLKNTTAAADARQASGTLFELPTMAIPFAFRGLAEQGAVRMKENSERMKAVSEEMTGALRESYLTSAKGAADYGLRVSEIVSANASAAFSFVGDLMTIKSVPEAVQLASTQARKNLETASAQNAELWELARRVATETAEPIKHGVDRILQKI